MLWGRKRNKTSGSSIKIAEQRPLLQCSLAQKLSLDLDVFTEDLSYCIHCEVCLFWGNLAFLGCLLWPFSTVTLPPILLYKQLNDVNFGMEFVTLGELTSFHRLLVSERTI